METLNEYQLAAMLLSRLNEENCTSQKPIMLVGPTGTGKTAFLKSLISAYNITHENKKSFRNLCGLRESGIPCSNDDVFTTSFDQDGDEPMKTTDGGICLLERIDFYGEGKNLDNICSLLESRRVGEAIVGSRWVVVLEMPSCCMKNMDSILPKLPAFDTYQVAFSNEYSQAGFEQGWKGIMLELIRDAESSKTL